MCGHSIQHVEHQFYPFLKHSGSYEIPTVLQKNITKKEFYFEKKLYFKVSKTLDLKFKSVFL